MKIKHHHYFRWWRWWITTTTTNIDIESTFVHYELKYVNDLIIIIIIFFCIENYHCYYPTLKYDKQEFNINKIPYKCFDSIFCLHNKMITKMYGNYLNRLIRLSSSFDLIWFDSIILNSNHFKCCLCGWWWWYMFLFELSFKIKKKIAIVILLIPLNI